MSAVGAPATGLSVFDSVRDNGQSGWFSVGGTSAAAPQWAGLIAVADQGLALAGVGALHNAQAALYALPPSAFHTVAGASSSSSIIGSGVHLPGGLGTPVAGGIISGLLASQGVHDGTLLTLPPVPAGSLQGLTVSHLDQTSSTSGPAASSSATSSTSSIFPVPFPAVTIVVIPVGPTTIIAIVPNTTLAHSPFASTAHPIQFETPAMVNLPSDTTGTTSTVGQPMIVDSLYSRFSRFSSGTVVADLIDVVEPMGGGPLPAIVPNKAAAPRLPGAATVMLPGAPSLVPATILKNSPGGRTTETGLAAELPPPAAPLVREASPDEQEPREGSTPRLAFATAVAVAGCLVAMRDLKGRRTFSQAAQPTRRLPAQRAADRPLVAVTSRPCRSGWDALREQSTRTVFRPRGRLANGYCPDRPRCATT